MGRPTKSAAYRAPIAAILGENIYALLPKAFKNAATLTDQMEALAVRCNIAPETIRRIAKGEVSPTLGKIDAIARGLGVHAWELLKPSEHVAPASPDGEGPFTKGQAPKTHPTRPTAR